MIQLNRKLVLKCTCDSYMIKRAHYSTKMLTYEWLPWDPHFPSPQPLMSLLWIPLTLKKLTPLFWTQRLIRSGHRTSAGGGGACQVCPGEAGDTFVFPARHELDALKLLTFTSVLLSTCLLQNCL